MEQLMLFGSAERAESIIGDDPVDIFKIWCGRLWKIEGSTMTSWPCGIDAELIEELESRGVKNIDKSDADPSLSEAFGI